MKDPAFLFYSKDFYEGTRMMLPEERACYIDLLMYQHQNEFIPNDFNRLSMYCSGISAEIIEATLKAKFKLCDKGWYNDKLLKVCNDRREFSDKQSVNGSVGQFWKKAKAILNQNEYTNLKEILYNKSNTQILEIIKDKNIDKAMLIAMLKHLANANVIVNANVNKDINKGVLEEKETEFYFFRLNQLENLDRSIYEKLKNDYKIDKPIIYAHKTEFPLKLYDLVEHLAGSISDSDWLQNLQNRFGDKNYKKGMIDYVSKLKTDFGYMDFKDTYDFRKYFANWFNLNIEKYK